MIAAFYRRWLGKPELVRAAVDAHVTGRVLRSADTGSLRSMFSEDSVSAELVARAVARGELPAGQAPRLARPVHEVVEAQVFRQMAAGGEFDRSFACHVVDDIVLPVLAAAAGQASQEERTADTRRSRKYANTSGQHRDHLVQVTVGGGPGDAVVAGQGVRGGAVAPQTVAESFDWEPAEVLGPGREAQVAGVEAAIWAETISGFDDLSFLLLPRLGGVAHKASSDPQLAGWAGHRDRLARHGRLWVQDDLTYFRTSSVDWL